MTNSPMVSILMPVYNAERFILPTLQSALAQDFADFELLIIDDASTDKTREKIAHFSDPRIRLIRHETNTGVSGATNTGFALAKGRYIAMMDHDDLYFPDRLRRQISFLEANPALDGCGAQHIVLSPSVTFDRIKALWKQRKSRFIPPEDVLPFSLFGGVLFNPTICFRSEILKEEPTGWHSEFSSGADTDFYQRVLARGKQFAILPKVVLRYRKHSTSLSRRSREVTNAAKERVVLAEVKRLCPNLSPEQQALHFQIVFRDKHLSMNDLAAIEAWFSELIAENERLKLYAPVSLCRLLAYEWSRVCAIAAGAHFKQGLSAYTQFAPLRPYTRSPLFFFMEWQKRQLGNKHKTR